jgi:hypothetical protein
VRRSFGGVNTALAWVKAQAQLFALTAGTKKPKTNLAVVNAK